MLLSVSLSVLLSVGLSVGFSVGFAVELSAVVASGSGVEVSNSAAVVFVFELVVSVSAEVVLTSGLDIISAVVGNCISHKFCVRPEKYILQHDVAQVVAQAVAQAVTQVVAPVVLTARFCYIVTVIHISLQTNNSRSICNALPSSATDFFMSSLSDNTLINVLNLR